MRSVLALSLVALAASGCDVIGAVECRHDDELAATVAAAAASPRVEVRALAGRLEIRGEAGAREVRVRGLACAGRERELELLDLNASAAGQGVLVEAVIPERARRRSARLDLSLVVPADAVLDVTDSSGDIEIEGVAAVRLEDGSGEVRLGAISGDVEITDGSGDLEVRGAGSVTIREDGLGDIEIDDVEGNVRVLADGTGGIEVRDVGGDLVVEEDGSGRVDHERVAGAVTIGK